LLLLTVPDGHLPSRRWWPVGVLLAGGYTAAVAGLLVVPSGGFVLDDLAGVAGLANALTAAGQLLITGGLVGGAAALVVRLHRARGEERQQLRWMAAAAAALGFAVVVAVVDGVASGTNQPRWQLQVLLYLGYLLVQMATGFAVMRYRLYDIDVIIGSTVRLGTLATFVTVGYITSVVGIGAIVTGSSSAVWPSLAAYVLVALAFQPLRQRVDRIADRIVYGERTAPYDSLADLSRKVVASGMSERQLLSLVARSSALAVGAESARVTVVVPGAENLRQWWPRETDQELNVTVPVAHLGEVLGRIDLALRPGHSFTHAQRKLVAELALQAALAFRNMRLTAALRGRAGELSRQKADLAASRRRLLTAAETERERIATAIRAKVAVHLDTLPVALADLQVTVTQDPDGAQRTLATLQEAVSVAIDSLRTVTAGVLPPLLARRGLAAAVEAYVDQSPSSCVAAVAPTALGRRLPTSVAEAAYLFCMRAVDVLPANAHLSVDVTNERLLVSVQGSTQGHHTLPDREQVLDRLEAVGGHLEEASDGVEGLVAVLPLELSAQAAWSRSGPNEDFRI
jgi:signal transduction histidine kinase